MKNINTFFAAIFSFFLAITATSVLAVKSLKNKNKKSRDQKKKGFCKPCGRLYKNIYSHKKRCKNIIRPQTLVSVIGKAIKKSKTDLPKLSKIRIGRRAKFLALEQQRKVQTSLALRPIILNSKTKNPPKKNLQKAKRSFSIQSIINH